MNHIITFLLLFIEIQKQFINYLMVLLIGKDFKSKSSNLDLVNEVYSKMQIDPFPKIETPELLDYKKLLAEYQHKGKDHLPIKRRKNSKARVPENLTCPFCGAPHNYLYDNNGGQGQFLCKVCNKTFNSKLNYSKSIKRKCPFCDQTLEKIKERKKFDVYKCKNNDCPYYKIQLSLMTKKEKELFKKAPYNFKLRYIYREFKFDFLPLSQKYNDPASLPKVDISNIHCSSHTLGLILTYYVNYHLSSRNTAAVMKDIHQLDISHQTVLNYAEAVGSLVKPFVDDYPYELSNCFCGDETYLKVKGKWQYLFFFFDAVKKIILSYRLSPNRDVLGAVKALDDVLSKIKSLPNNLAFVVDGNPIYLLAQHYFKRHGINFDILQVIGLTNDDPVSEEYRPLKEIIERLNRTFKRSYRTTSGFKSSAGSVCFTNLFVAYFNFLRPHSALEKKTPVIIPELEVQPHMPARWGKLIALAQEHIIELQNSA